MDFDEEDLGMMVENPRPKTSGRERETFGNRPGTGWVLWSRRSVFVFTCLLCVLVKSNFVKYRKVNSDWHFNFLGCTEVIGSTFVGQSVFWED
jgi:hypothetical protein